MKATYYLTILGICAFAVFTGARASSLRAAIMGSLVLFALSRGQKTDIVGTLALAAFTITFLDPAQLFQAGFILSFGAVLSIIYIAPLIDGLLRVSNSYSGRAGKIITFFKKSISVSASVWIGSFPITLLYFKLITPYVIFANLIAVPALFLMIISGISLLFIGSITVLEPLTRILALFTSSVISIFLQIMKNFNSLPFSYFEVTLQSGFLVAIYYFVLIPGMICYNNKKLNSVDTFN